MEDIQAVKRHLVTSQGLRELFGSGGPACAKGTPCFDQTPFAGPPDNVAWRVIDHSAAVTRLYALYEQFAHELIRQHVNLLQKHFSYGDLDVVIQKAYRSGFAKIIEKKETPRFKDLVLADLVADYSSTLSGAQLKLEPRIFLLQDQNLRLNELDRLFAACGVSNVEKWIEDHPLTLGFFEDQSRFAASAGSEMLKLVDYRNEASHGGLTLDDVLGLDVHIEFCDFIAVICEVLTERLQLAALVQLQQQGLAKACGDVTELLKAKRVIIAPVEGSFEVGQTVYLVSTIYCLTRHIKSIQVNDASEESFVTSGQTEVGFLIDQDGKKGASIFVLAPPPAAPAEPESSVELASGAESDVGADEMPVEEGVQAGPEEVALASKEPSGEGQGEGWA